MSYAKDFLPDGTPESAAEVSPLSPRRVLHLLRRRWFLFASMWLLIVLGAVALSMTVTPVYRPQATLEVRPEMPINLSENVDPTYLASLQMWSNFYRTQETLLRSPSLVQDVLHRLPPPLVADYQRQPDPVKAFLENLDVEKTESSYILKVGFTDPDAERATILVNTLVAKYLEDTDRRLREIKTATLEVLTNKTLPEIRKRFDEAEKALQRFQDETGYADFEVEFTTRVENLRRVDARLSEARLKSFKITSDIDALQSYSTDGMAGLYHEAFKDNRALDTLIVQRAALTSEIARQVGVLKDQHPRRIEAKNDLAKVDGQIRDTIQGILASFRKTLDSITAEEKKLAVEKSRLEEDMGNSRRRLTEYKRLDAELTTAKDLYNAYLKKHSETRATSTAGQAGVRVVDPAMVPVEPYKKPNWILGLGIVAGFILACASVGIAEQMNDRLRSAEEVEVFLGLQVLGQIPAPGDGNTLLPDDESEPATIEAFRDLRAQLVTRLEEITCGKIILVTSAESGEGKSSVAANLARVLAMEDQRVLLFDGEMRWPRMKALLGDPRGRGLEELLRGEVTLQDAVQRSRIPGVDVIGADTGLIRAAEMAGSMRFQAALRSAREQYDFVVIDSAAVNLVSETALIARRTDATLLVVRQGRTSRGAARAARKRLDDLKAPLLGAVLTDAALPETLYGYPDRRDPVREDEVIEKEGDDLVGVV